MTEKLKSLRKLVLKVEMSGAVLIFILPTLKNQEVLKLQCL